jgi:hypothetical protein
MALRARARADVEERAVFGVIRDLAARSRAVAADADTTSSRHSRRHATQQSHVAVCFHDWS